MVEPDFAGHIITESFCDGYVFYNNLIYKKQEILSLFENCNSFEQFCDINSRLNGMYSICLLLQEHKFLYLSPGGFHKMFYAKQTEGYAVSVKASLLNPNKFNQKAIDEFRTGLYCWGDNTLYEGVYSVEPGIAVSLTNSTIKKRRIFAYDTILYGLSNKSFISLIDMGKIVFNHVIDRMVQYLNGKQAVIPLSGGYDSRFIISALVSRGHSDILAFTYGTTNTKEYQNAQKTAQILGIHWEFIEYNHLNADQFIGNCNLDSYFEFMVNGNSFPSMHEIIALSWLENKGLLKPEATFIPGHSGDLLGGSQFIKVFPTSLKYHQITPYLIREKLSYFPHPENTKREISISLEKYLNSWYTPDLLPASIFEDIDMREKLSKHILNASRVYSYYGYNYYFPFWDMELIDFFKNIPPEFKIEKKLYNGILKQLLFIPFKIDFSRELHPSVARMLFQKLKQQVKPFLPVKFKQNLMLKNDTNLYYYITRNWRKQMSDSNFIPCNYDFNLNSIIAQWIIYRYFNKQQNL